MSMATPTADGRCATARWMPLGAHAPQCRSRASAHGLSRAVSRPAYGLCRSAADKGLLTEIGGWADWAPKWSSVRPEESTHGGASVHYHHHREASFANSLSDPNSTPIDTPHSIAGTTWCSPIAPPFACVH
jgi:hypothetical protein